MALLPIDTALLAALTWIAVGLAGLGAARNFAVVTKLLFPLGAGVALVLAGSGLAALGGTPEVAVLPIGLPNLPMHYRLDSLSAFFLVLLGAAAAGISVFSSGYFRSGEGTAPGLLCFQYHLFLAAMALVLLADDAYAFMVAWETMALASYFLVTTQHRIPEIRAAGFLYLLIAHLGAVAILLCFGVLQGNVGDYTFAAMRRAELSPAWASAGFLLALVGFGAKAGLLPLHVWLPEAHPAAPSPVSAMMSGVMLKTAIYGLLRVSYDLLPVQPWWWGVLLLALGLATALCGVIFSAVQTDMKRLLAYSSIENVGLIAVGLGLALTFGGFAMPGLAALALTAALYHCLNHAFFKSLLFLSTGSVLHATHERSLGKLGGLIHSMPWVAWLTLVGTLAIAGLPPLNGFVSEWLLLQAFLLSPGLPQSYLNMLIPVAAAAVALAAALAGFVMVKFFAIVFLGQPREESLTSARDASWRERLGLGWLAAGCLFLGLFPALVIGAIDPVTTLLIGKSLGNAAGHWLLLAPLSPDRASYSPLIVFLVLAGAGLLIFIYVHRAYHGRSRRSPAWDCGYPFQNPRMQDTAEGYSQPIRTIFEPFFRIDRHLPGPAERQPRYHLNVGDPLWHWLYLPLAAAITRFAALVGRLQQGRIAIYLLYSFLTLILLLVFALR